MRDNQMFGKGKPMDHAPKDKPILAYCKHDEDPYVLEDGRLTTYGAHAEGASHAEDGFHIVEWGGEYFEYNEYIGEPNIHIPDWRFIRDSDTVANPILYWDLPEEPKDNK